MSHSGDVTPQRKLYRKTALCFNLSQVEMSWKSFYLGDVFLLDIGKTIIQWNGPRSSKQERLKVRFMGQHVSVNVVGSRTHRLFVTHLCKLLSFTVHFTCYSQSYQIVSNAWTQCTCLQTSPIFAFLHHKTINSPTYFESPASLEDRGDKYLDIKLT